MSELPQQNWSYPEDFEIFALVIDGEVATTHGIQKETLPLEMAAWSSDPKIVQSTVKSFIKEKYLTKTGIYPFQSHTFLSDFNDH